MKITACIFIILLSVLIGIGLRHDIKRRCDSLTALSHICEKMQSEIAFRAPPIKELIARFTDEKHCGELFSDALQNIEKGFPAAFAKSAAKWTNAVGLTEEEKEIVLLLSSLGGNDTQGEIKLLTEVSGRLREQREFAQNELNTKGKMLFSCSMLSGLALVIIVI